MSNGRLQLEHADFWAAPTKNKDQVLERISEQELLGLLIDAPGVVPLEGKDSIPIVAYYARSLRESVQVQPEEQLIGVAVDLTTNEVRLALVLQTDRRRPPAETGPQDDPGVGKTITAHVIEGRSIFGIPWEPARYQVSLLLRQHRSNPVTIALGGSAATFEDAEVARFIAANRIVPPPEPVAPPLPVEPALAGVEALPSYRSGEGSPPVPTEPGIALSAPRVSLLTRRARCVVRGTFRLPVRPRERVRPDAATGARPDVGEPRATAVVPITLVLTGASDPGPYAVTLHVPSYDPVDLQAEAPVVTGHFHVDLLDLEAMPRAATTYFVHAYCGEVAVGPTLLSFVTEAMLVG